MTKKAGGKAEKDAARIRRAEEKARLKQEKEAARKEAKQLADEDKARKAQEKARLKAGGNSSEMPDAERQKLFLTHVDMRKRLDAEKKSLDKKFEEALAAAVNDGFSKRMLNFAIDGEDPKKDVKIRREVQELMQVALWMGSPLNTQFNLFGPADPKTNVMVVDQAHAEGRAASAEGRPRHVPVQYPPGTEAFNAWLDGFDGHQRELHAHIGRGNRPPDQGGDKTAEKPAEKPAGNATDKIKPEDATSGTPMTRSKYEESLQGLGAQTKKIIEEAGGTPASSSDDLAKDQGISED